jgi:hypothetical protein
MRALGTRTAQRRSQRVNHLREVMAFHLRGGEIWFDATARARADAGNTPQARRTGMAGRVAGKVALITGAACGPGRSHAIRFAQVGADIIAADLAAQIATAPYPL